MITALVSSLAMSVWIYITIPKIGIKKDVIGDIELMP